MAAEVKLAEDRRAWSLLGETRNQQMFNMSKAKRLGAYTLRWLVHDLQT